MAEPILPAKSDIKAQHHLLAGALSGLSSAISLQPLDLLKTRLQQGYEAGGPKRRRLRVVVRQVLHDDGIFGFWRGTVPTLTRNIPGVAIYFYTLSTIRTRLSSTPYFQKIVPDPSAPRSSKSALVKLSSQGNLVAGAISRTSVSFILNPITVLKARYESNFYTEYHSLLSAFRSLLATNGVRGLFQGFTATAVRDAPYAGISLVFYEKSKDFLGRVSSLPNAVLHSASGASAAMMATLATSPADCVKTRMQVNPQDHPTIRKAVIRIYNDRGIAGFFSGSTLRISRKAGSGAIAWTVYEGLLLFLRDYQGR
ncbi:mitochondrial carrier domain-containing protein [Naematelia encephala]|uniref:Mitochondrial glycine transporter n=1 Tax=Naematelia encephala TaxID=71784 RepID=A0A1Y2BM79_9TREE|nr:mitochondrial carrier domain-containing protein [Naematelia encephala]